MHIQVEALINVVRKAGNKILEIYETDFQVENKEDQSPLTEADRTSHAMISKELQTLYPNIPILSEEGKQIPYEARKKWSYFWLVDPLDGTKEFIKKNGEFSVNIALIKDMYPVLGMVHVPITALTYIGDANGAYVIDAGNNSTPLSADSPDEGNITLVESRSHPSPELNKLLSKIKQKYAQINRIQKGSSLKLCAVAEGVAHFYPRLGPTMEWDTAAGQAIVEAAGGKMIDLQGRRFHYNKESLVNESFLAIGKMDMSDFI